MVTRTASLVTAAFFASLIYFFTVFALNCQVIRVDAMAAMNVPKNIVVVGGGIQGTSVERFDSKFPDFCSMVQKEFFRMKYLMQPICIVIVVLPSFRKQVQVLRIISQRIYQRPKNRQRQ